MHNDKATSLKLLLSLAILFFTISDVVYAASAIKGMVEDQAQNKDCGMYVRPLKIGDRKIKYDHYSKKLGEHTIAFENGDVLIARYGKDCELAFDITYLATNPLHNIEEKVAELAWLVNLFKDDEESNQNTKAILKARPELKQEEFSVTVVGIRLGERHCLSVQTIKPNSDVYFPMFKQIRSYTWLAPEGEF